MFWGIDPEKPGQFDFGRLIVAVSNRFAVKQANAMGTEPSR
jgi:hypothetical protein